MATDLDSTFNEQFMAINTKLKKRFMRRPNIVEALNEFLALAKQCENAEQPAFAAQCYVGAAKCEAIGGNGLCEADYYLKAARQFMKEEKKLKTLKLQSPDRENLEAAIGSYMQAIPKYPEGSPKRVSILMELADDLSYLKHNKEALLYYKQALKLLEDKTRIIMHLKAIMQKQIDCNDYESALETANKICDEHRNIPKNTYGEILTARVLLTMLVNAPEDERPASLQKLFDDLMNDDVYEELPFNKDFTIKLQSIVICCTWLDIPKLIKYSIQLKPFLSLNECNLLDILVERKKSQVTVSI